MNHKPEADLLWLGTLIVLSIAGAIGYIAVRHIVLPILEAL